jgi:hypothetical protein
VCRQKVNPYRVPAPPPVCCPRTVPVPLIVFLVSALAVNGVVWGAAMCRQAHARELALQLERLRVEEHDRNARRDVWAGYCFGAQERLRRHSLATRR